jgi:hypothetical protein
LNVTNQFADRVSAAFRKEFHLFNVVSLFGVSAFSMTSALALASVISVENGNVLTVTSTFNLLDNCANGNGKGEMVKPQMSWIKASYYCAPKVVISRDELESLGLMPSKPPEGIRVLEKSVKLGTFMTDGSPFSAAPSAEAKPYVFTIDFVPVADPSQRPGGPYGASIIGYGFTIRATTQSSNPADSAMSSIRARLSRFTQTQGSLRLQSNVNLPSAPQADRSLRHVFVTSSQVFESGLGGYGGESRVLVSANSEVQCIFDKLTQFAAQVAQGNVATRCRFTNARFGTFPVDSFDVSTCVPAIPVDVTSCE